jgi:ethanolaminephosphotransferase
MPPKEDEGEGINVVSDDAAGSSSPARPRDNHKMHIWCWEPTVRGDHGRGVLTKEGLNQIAHHQYKGGSYTTLDAFLSPNLWEPLTEMLPLWLAPNLVTTIGGFFCLASFFLSSTYLDLYLEEGVPPPRWVYFANGACLAVYYTFDCMDGKQARRTGSSSPLGQLFDHGMDCLCNLSHLRMAQCIVLLPNSTMVYMQASLQFSFWQAQWDEYYTGVLPHAAGDLGVTELNYGMAAWSVLTGIFGRNFYEYVVFENTTSGSSSSSSTSSTTTTWEVRHVLEVLWITMISVVVMISWIRVYRHVKDVRVFFSAFTKFTSPGLLFLLASADGRLALGLCYCLITIKLIVYSMARMSYASLQLDILPYCLAVLVDRYVLDDQSSSSSSSSTYYSTLLFYALDIFYLGRLSYWIHEAIHQLCERLQIPLFRIKPKNDNDTKTKES